MQTLILLLLCVLYAVLNVTGTALIKKSVIGYTLNGVAEYLSFLFQFPVVLGLALNFCSMLVVVKALSAEKFVYVFPVAIGINFGFTALAGHFVFNERLTPAALLGLVLIFSGVAVTSIANHAS